MKWVGVLLICGGCLWWSMRACRRRQLTLLVLEDMARAVEYLERELELGRRPLPELLERLSERGSPPSERVFRRCREALEQGNSFSGVWSRILEEETELDREERHVLEPLGWLLGRYDAQGQSVSLMRMQQRLEPMIEQRRRKTGQQICVIRALGVTAGGFLSLTLI